MVKKTVKTIILCFLVFALTFTVAIPQQISFAAEDTYQQRFMEMWNKIHDPANGYFNSQGIPYHSVETLICEAPDYGHETTSEAFSYYMWLEAMYGKFTGDWTKFAKAWDITEQYMIPSDQDQPATSMSRYTPSKPATYAPEWELPSLYPAKLDSSAPVGVDPIHNELVSAYNTSNIYGMHWLLDVDNWYGFGQRGDGISKPSFFNTFQRGSQESVWETIPQPCWDAMKFGGKNGYLDLFTGDSTYAKQFKYTNAPDADSRAVQATYWANQWAKEQGKDVSTYVGKAAKMGDYLRYAMFDKYFRKIGTPSAAGTGYDAAHYLLSWYYAWGGALDGGWSWKIGSSHNHFGYQNPLAAWVLSTDPAFKPKSANGATDWAKSLTRQLEFYQWLQSSEGAIAGGASNSNNGRYEPLPAGTSTFYGMGYEANPVYHDPGSNTWFGFQAWSMQRVAEYYYKTKDVKAKNLLDKWAAWVKTQVLLKADGTFEIPASIDWAGQPDTWTGTYTGNPNLHVTVTAYGTDLGIAASLANTLLYYSAASGDDQSRVVAKELLDRMWNLYRDSKGLSAPETREDYKRFFEQEVYVPSGWTGTMPNGDVIKSGDKFIDIRSKYKNDPDWPKVVAAYNAGTAPTFNYHRFWAQCDIAIANGVYSMLFGTPSNNSSISPTTAAFDKNVSKQTDVAVTITLNGNTFNGIKNDTTALVSGTDYTVSGSTVTILKSYLAKQAVGTTSLTFDFSAGIDPVLTIAVTDTTPSASITPTTATFDKSTSKQTDIAVTITPNGNTLNGIKNGTAALVSGTDYTVSGNTVTILKEYLAKQAVGTTSLTFDFSAGIDPVLTVSVVDTSGSIKIQMFNGNTAAATNGISPRFKLVNTGNTAVKLSDVKLRYYYTVDGEKAQNFWCDWSTIGSANVAGTFVKLPTAKTGADYYLEIGFTSGAGNLAAGQSIEVQARFAKADWTNYTQTGDYSFDATDTSYVDWSKATAHMAGSLVWGVEP